MEIFESVPNISAGATPEVINMIIAELGRTGVSLLHTDRGPGVNRTVLTFAGSYQQMLEAAGVVYEIALSKIDMRQHRGAHPRIGAVDVFPIVPLFGSSMDRAITLAREIGCMVFERFNLPVFFYEEAAYSPLHLQLPRVRQGEFEGLPQRSDFPDLWNGEYHPSGGATIIGARKILVAYNLTVASGQRQSDKENQQHLEKVKKIAAQMRSKITRSPESGKLVGGSRPHLRAIGWQLSDTKELQISCNLTDYTVTSISNVFKLANEYVRDNGWIISSSEVIGLCPAKAILADCPSLQAGQKIPSFEELAKDPNLAQKLSEQIRVAVKNLKIKDFAPESKVLELVCAKKLFGSAL